MKTKSILLGAAALMLAASCSNDEVVNVAPQSGAIGFSSFVNNSTRAEDNTPGYNTDALPADIQVYGLTSREPSAEGVSDGVASTLIFNAEVLKSSDNWTYSPLRYWVAGNDYSFAAFAPSTNSNVTGATMTAQNGLTFSFNNQNANAMEDLLYAGWTGKEVASNNGTVEFTFSHMLSRAKFEFTSAVVNENVKIAVSDIEITNAVSTADFTGVDGSKMVWENAGEKDFTVGFKTDGTQLAKDDHEASVSKYLIPLNDERAYVVKFNVTLYQKDLKDNTFVAMKTYPHTVTIPERTYQSNYSYIFKATIDDNTISEDELNPILFDVVSVDVWKDPEDPAEDNESAEPQQ